MWLLCRNRRWYGAKDIAEVGVPLGAADDDVVAVQRIRDGLAQTLVLEDPVSGVESDVMDADPRAGDGGKESSVLRYS